MLVGLIGVKLTSEEKLSVPHRIQGFLDNGGASRLSENFAARRRYDTDSSETAGSRERASLVQPNRLLHFNI